MSLPSVLNVDINEIKDFRKTLVSFHPEEISRKYKPQDRIRLNFPKGLLDLSTFNLFYDARGSFYRLVSNGGLFYSLNYHFPKHTQSIIQSLRVFINNQEVSNIDEFNTIYNIVYDIENDTLNNNATDNQNAEFKTLSLDGYQYDTSYNVAYSRSARNLANILSSGWFRYSAQPSEPTFTESLGISEWIGFFRDIKYINTHNIDLSIEIELADAHIMFIQTVDGTTRRGGGDTQIIDGGSPDYTIYNVKANIHKLDFEGAPNILNNDLTFTDYVSRKGPKLTVDKNQKLTMNIKANCIQKLIATFLRNTRETETAAFQSNLTNHYGVEYQRLIREDATTRLGNSIYFKRQGKGIKNVSFYIDDIPINNNPLTMIEIERETKHAFNIKKTLWNDVYEFQNDFFSAVMSLEDHIKKKDGIVKSGYNTNGRNAKIMFESQAFGVPAGTLNAADFIGQPILFVETQRTIMIENNNVSIS